MRADPLFPFFSFFTKLLSNSKDNFSQCCENLSQIPERMDATKKSFQQDGCFLLEGDREGGRSVKGC